MIKKKNNSRKKSRKILEKKKDVSCLKNRIIEYSRTNKFLSKIKELIKILE